MKKIISAFIFVSLLCIPTAKAEASLLGDLIFFQHDAGGFTFASGSSVVQNGLGDTFSFNPYYTVNPEATDIYVDFTFDAQWNSNSFNGLLISDIDNEIVDYTVSTNLAGWDNSRVKLDSSSIGFDWYSLPFNTQSYFNVDLDFGSGGGGNPGGGNTVPEPSTMLLLSTGLAGLYLKRKKA